jgi:hypothetical protein
LTSLDNIKCLINHVSNGFCDGEVIDWEREQFAHLDDKRINQIYDFVIKFGTNEAESSGDILTGGVQWSDEPLPSIFNPLKN